MYTRMRLGEFFREHRLAQGKFQREVAHAIGVCRQTITDLEAGKKSVTSQTVFNLFLHYGVSLSDFDDYCKGLQYEE